MASDRHQILSNLEKLIVVQHQEYCSSGTISILDDTPNQLQFQEFYLSYLNLIIQTIYFLAM